MDVEETLEPWEALECGPCDLSQDSSEAKPLRRVIDPMKPTRREIDEHERSGHCPYRSWCRVCDAARGKEAGHPRLEDDNSLLPEVGLDYDHLGNKEDDDDAKVTALVMKDKKSGSLWGHRVDCKGPSDAWSTNRVVKNLETLGRRDITLKTDGEPALVAAQTKVIGARAGMTVPVGPPAYDPQANGAIEKGVQDWNTQLRALKLALEAHIGCSVPSTCAAMEWMMQHAGFVHSRFQVGHDGKTPWQRLTGKVFNGVILEFGEQCWGQLAKRRTPQKKLNTAL